MPAATVSLTLTRTVLRYAVARGASMDAICEFAGISSAQLASPDNRITSEQSHRVWEAAIDATGDKDFGLHLGELSHPASLGLVGFVMLSSINLGDALRSLIRYVNLLTNGVQGRLEVAGDMAVFLMEPTTDRENPLVAAPRQRIECTFSSFVALTHALTGRMLPVASVDFLHPAPSRTTEHGRIFHAPVAFSQPINRLSFAAAALSWPNLEANPTLRASLEAKANDLLGHLDRSETWAGRTQYAIARRLRGEAPTIETIARELGVSVRSLQRQLSEEGTTYRAALDQVRDSCARRHLDSQDTTVEEISFVLGFSEASAFHRSFKRWTGLTPQAYRQRAKAG